MSILFAVLFINITPMIKVKNKKQIIISNLGHHQCARKHAKY